MSPVRLSDAELQAVINPAQPLPHDLRDPFLRAVAHELLSGPDVIGPGTVHRVCKEQQRVFMNGAWPDVSRSRDVSKYR